MGLTRGLGHWSLKTLSVSVGASLTRVAKEVSETDSVFGGKSSKALRLGGPVLHQSLVGQRSLCKRSAISVNLGLRSDGLGGCTRDGESRAPSVDVGERLGVVKGVTSEGARRAVEKCSRGSM